MRCGIHLECWEWMACSAWSTISPMTRDSVSSGTVKWSHWHRHRLLRPPRLQRRRRRQRPSTTRKPPLHQTPIFPPNPDPSLTSTNNQIDLYLIQHCSRLKRNQLLYFPCSVCPFLRQLLFLSPFVWLRSIDNSIIFCNTIRTCPNRPAYVSIHHSWSNHGLALFQSQFRWKVQPNKISLTGSLWYSLVFLSETCAETQQLSMWLYH